MTWADDVRAATAAGEVEVTHLSNDLATATGNIALLNKKVADLQAQLDAIKPPPPPPPPTSGVKLGYAGDDPNGKAKALRVYLNPGEAFPKPVPGVLHVVTYKGTDHAARAAQAKAYGAPLLFGWTHEPENSANNIPSSTYKAGWTTLNAELTKVGATNVKRIWCLMSVSFNSGTANAYYPGDTQIDVVAADGYDWCGCKDIGNRYANPNGTHRSMGQIFQNVAAFAKTHAKQVAFLEFGTPAEKGGSESARAAWVKDAANYCRSKPSGVDVVAATYFQHDAGFKCVWALKGASQAAWEAEF